MSDHAPAPHSPRPLERRIRKIVAARSITLSFAMTFVGLAAGGAVAIRLLDRESFSSYGLAFWWLLQTVTTIGYGDVVPSGVVGKVIGGIEMVVGVAFISFLTAGVTSVIVQQGQAQSEEVDRQRKERGFQKLVDTTGEIRTAIADLDRRLDQAR